jgi:hypothetical protein
VRLIDPFAGAAIRSCVGLRQPNPELEGGFELFSTLLLA